MTETECKCGQPTRNQAFVCHTCARDLTRALIDVSWLAGELETTITRQKGAAYTGNTTKAAETPSPVHWGASEARTHLRSVLVSWALFCASTGVRNASPHPGLPADTLHALSQWLLWRVDGLTLHDAGPDAVANITDAVRRCYRVIDRPPDRVYAGQCGAPDEDTAACEADLYAKPGAHTIRCRLCGFSWDVDERRSYLLAAAEEHLATAVEISRAVTHLGTQQLTADRIRQWAARGRLVARGHDLAGRPLYRIGDAIDLLAKSAAPKAPA